MSRSTLAFLSTAVCVVAAAAICVVMPDPVARGSAIGAALGIVNLVVGTAVMNRVLRTRPADVMLVIGGGFGARMFLLAGLLSIFAFTTGVSPAAFGFTFIGFVILYFAVEITMAARLRTGGTA